MIAFSEKKHPFFTEVFHRHILEYVQSKLIAGSFSPG